MKVLITGAAGSLGRRLVEKLSSDSRFEIFATDIKTDPFHVIKKLDNNLNYFQSDLTDQKFDQWVRDVKPNKIIHLASILQLSPKMTRDRAYKIDVLATKKLIQTSVEIGVDKLIVTSSGAAYGYYPENKNIITEQREPKGNQDYFYSAHKAEVEGILASYRKEQPQLKQIVFRPGAILGPDFEGPILDLFNQKIITGLIGYPGPFNFIWSEDVVDFMIEGVVSDITGEFNIAGDGSLTMAEIAKKLDKPYLSLPAPLIQLALAIAKPLGLTQFGPEQVKFIKYRPVLSNDKIKQQFQHQPRYSSAEVLEHYLSYNNTDSKRIDLTEKEVSGD